MQFIQYKSQPLWRQYYLQQCRVYYITVNIIVSTDSLTGLDMGESNSQIRMPCHGPPPFLSLTHLTLHYKPDITLPGSLIHLGEREGEC